ncbi:MAG: SRPBCC domain-containing protein [Granulosicoccus sp.]
MKKILTFFIALLFVGIIYLQITGSELQEIKTEIEISAPPTKVWSIISDIESWQEWSPTINASRGVASVGSQLSITMMSEEAGKDGPNYKPTIIELAEPNYFHWRAHMLAEFLFTNEKIIKLEEIDSGTRLTHTETFKGLLTPLFRGKMEKGVSPMLKLMNKALKELAEK